MTRPRVIPQRNIQFIKLVFTGEETRGFKTSRFARRLENADREKRVMFGMSRMSYVRLGPAGSRVFGVVGRFRKRIPPLCFLLLSLCLVSAGLAQTPIQLSVAWDPNPPSDNIAG